MLCKPRAEKARLLCRGAANIRRRQVVENVQVSDFQRTFRLVPPFWNGKFSANRVKYQTCLSISEVPPKLRRRQKVSVIS